MPFATQSMPIGSIPACAGEPAGGGSGEARERVYPRVCGGTKPQRACLTRIQGLSPRVRGNLTIALHNAQ